MFDFGITDNGELRFDNQTKDIDKNQDDGMIRQIAVCRIKSVVGDWFNTNIGANLEEFLGAVCNQATAGDIQEAMENALIYDGFLSKSDLFFIPQIEENSISFLVFINSQFGKDPNTINVKIDTVGGVKIQYDSFK
jgi:hypothetical protein